MTLTGTTTPGQSGPGSNGDEGVLHFGWVFNFFTHIFKIHFSIYPIDMTLTGTTTPGQSVSESNGDKGVLLIPQSFRI